METEIKEKEVLSNRQKVMEPTRSGGWCRYCDCDFVRDGSKCRHCGARHGVRRLKKAPK